MSLASHLSSLPRSSCPALSSFLCPDGWGEAWLAPAKVMYDHMGLRAERARTLGVSGWAIGNERPGATASNTSPWCSVLKSPAVGVIHTGTRGRKASWQAGETDGPQAPGLAPQASCRPSGLSVSFCYQAPAGMGTRNFLYLEAVPPGRTVPLLGSQSLHP